MFNCCLRFQHFPTPWKTATVIMIPKIGKDLKNPSSHQPIALINSMAKVLEIIILIKLKKVISTSIQPDQYAFRPKHSMTNLLTKVIDHLVNTTNREERTAAVLLDFEKAFDKVWHDGLLHKLLQLHVPPSLVRIVQSFNSDRTYSVRVGSAFSSPRTPMAGVSRGSCLLPILFISYINDMPSTSGTWTNLFAHDTIFMATSMGMQHAVEKLQAQIDVT